MKVNQLKVMIRTLQLKIIYKKNTLCHFLTKHSNSGRNMVQTGTENGITVSSSIPRDQV